MRQGFVEKTFEAGTLPSSHGRQQRRPGDLWHVVHVV